MNKETSDLLYTLPQGLPSYASDLTDLDEADIPQDRIPKLRILLKDANEYIALEAARLLCSWADDEGFDFIQRFVCDREPLAENWMPHRLRVYDDTYKHLLDALIRYWAKNSDNGNGITARKKIVRPVSRIIIFSNINQFEIKRIFWLIEDEGFTEYIPELKSHLTEILKNPEFHHWKIGDCAHLLQKFDPEFVTKTLAAHGKTLADYPVQ
ncbi:hypothetical protein J2X19_003131 [Rhodoferax ferrireducens]|uniref:HEAT repeat domain-containing protein n=1 Tax=Rhodoferax ferrireducens TaxID=192843 RepID=A0ABU2CB34_9BURK|nr:hypothetical protein [Rhodoferax ferrireducens]MDR7378437.1 hypothetical protein [Rhodoferax ferrireducens]